MPDSESKVPAKYGDIENISIKPADNGYVVVAQYRSGDNIFGTRTKIADTEEKASAIVLEYLKTLKVLLEP